MLTAGAAALGRPVHLFLQYWALDAFRADRIERDHGLAPEAGAAGRAAVDALRAAGQVELGRDAAPGQGPRRRRHPGLLAVDGPAPPGPEADLDPLVDGVEGVTGFYLEAGDGPMVFI